MRVQDRVRHTGWAVGTLAVVAGMVLSACGSAGGSSEQPAPAAESSAASDGGNAAPAEDYQKIAEDAMKAVSSFNGPTDGPAAQTGKTIVFLACGFAGEGCLTAAQAAEGAGEALGWKVTLADGKFDPTVFERTIQQAIDAKVDGIIVDAVDADAVAGPIAAARKAGIVVGSYDSRNEPSDTAVSFDVRMSFPLQGKALAAYMIWKNDGKAHPLILNSPEFKGTAEWTASAAETFKGCAACSVIDEQDFTASEAPTKLPPMVVTEKQQHADMNAVLVPYDAAMLPIIPAMKQAGILDSVKTGTFNATKPSVELIRKGELTATVAEPHSWGVWATMDNMNRVFAGEEAVEQNIPIRLITKDNVGDIPEGQAWDGDGVDYKSAYKAIWSGQK